MNGVFFTNLNATLLQLLETAEKSIEAAVCWITDQEIKKILLKKAFNGLNITLITEYDVKNVFSAHPGFNEMLAAGVTIHGHLSTGLVHHKFAVIDSKMVITGSFNWTNARITDNFITTDCPDIVRAFEREFQRLARLIQPVSVFKPEKAKGYIPVVHQEVNINTLKLAIARGCGCWLIRPGRSGPGVQEMLDACGVFTTAAHIFHTFRTAHPWWDGEAFKNFIQEHKPALAGKIRSEILAFAFKIQIGDLIFLQNEEKMVVAAGVITGEPAPFIYQPEKTIRPVKWLPLPSISDTSTNSSHRASPGYTYISKYKGSGIALLQSLLERP